MTPRLNAVCGSNATLGSEYWADLQEQHASTPTQGFLLIQKSLTPS